MDFFFPGICINIVRVFIDFVVFAVGSTDQLRLEEFVRWGEFG